MKDINEMKCEHCSYYENDNPEDTSLWCNMHRDYFEKDDGCSNYLKPSGKADPLKYLVSSMVIGNCFYRMD